MQNKCGRNAKEMYKCGKGAEEMQKSLRDKVGNDEKRCRKVQKKCEINVGKV